MSRIEQAGAWPARVLWVVLALVAGGCLDDALDGRSAGVGTTARVLLGVAWTAGLIALLVPRSTSLTLVRVVVPGGLAVAVAATVTGSEVDGSDVVAVSVAALAVAAALAPWVADAWVDGSSYGPERRYTLRTPVVFTVALVPLAWMVIAAGISVGPLLLAARQWAAGAVALVVGLAAAAVGARALHQLARRWVVLVPAGMVLHDPLTMPEPQLFPRRTIARLRPAAAGSDAEDLTAGAAGLALQLDLVEPIDLLVRTRGRAAEARSATSLLFTPGRPAHLLTDATERRIAVARG